MILRCGMMRQKLGTQIILGMMSLAVGTKESSSCKYCDGLSGRSCLDVLSMVIAREETGQRVQSIEAAFAGSDRCTGASELTSCLERYEITLLSTGRGARLNRLRSACISGGLGQYSVQELLSFNKDSTLAEVTGLGGWSLGTSGIESVTCGSCSTTKALLSDNNDFIDCISRQQFFQNTKAVAITNNAEFAVPAFIAACAAIERGESDLFSQHDPDAPLADSCTICTDSRQNPNEDMSEDEDCSLYIKGKIDNALTEDALSVYELAFAGASDQCKLGISAKDCVYELSNLLFYALDVNDRADALRRACRSALHARILSNDRDSAIAWTNLLLSPPIQQQISSSTLHHPKKRPRSKTFSSSEHFCAAPPCHFPSTHKYSSSLLILLFFVFSSFFLLWLKQRRSHRAGYSRLPNKTPVDDVGDDDILLASVVEDQHQSAVLIDSRNFRRTATSTTTMATMTPVAIPMYRL